MRLANVRLVLTLAAVCIACGCATAREEASSPVPMTRVDSLLARAADEGWGELPIGERVARFGLALEGTPYADGTLEGPGPEQCRITMQGFDCVTFMEVALNLARISEGTPEKVPTLQDLREAVTYTRYRGGRLTDYTSRLHYTSEWIADNEVKGVLEDVTDDLGGEPCDIEIDFMSEHPDSYAALAANPAFVDSIRIIERRISLVPRTCIPKAEVAAVENRLRTGDLIAIRTSIKGLDYSHTGMIVRDANDVPRFLHASSKNGRVFLDGRLSEYLASGPKSSTGVSVLRPIAGGD